MSPPCRMSSKPRILVISQVYVPDPAAVGQYMADAAATLVERGYDVRVLTSARGYEDPSAKYPRREMRDGVEIIRLPLSSFGKKTLLLRLLGQLLFVMQAAVRGLFTPRLASILVSTSPPMAGSAALFIRFFRRVPMSFWVMDLNVDQLIASGSLNPRSPFGWLLKRSVTKTLHRSHAIVALDRFMQQRIKDNYGLADRVHVIPPWPLEDQLEPVPHDQNKFRNEHDLDGKFVFMYSGNMGIGHPIGVLLEAAQAMEDLEHVKFVFIGGGVRRAEIEAAIRDRQPPNLLLLPYQPLSELRFSLSAADVHLATMEESGIGYFHPCKVYGAMTVARPILFAGPEPSHVTDLIERYNIGWRVSPDDPAQAASEMRRIAELPAEALQSMGQQARQAIEDQLSRNRLCQQFCDAVAPKPN